MCTRHSSTPIYWICTRVGLCIRVYLLLVFPLQVKSGLDVSSRLLEGLSLGDLGGVVGADADDVGAEEDQDVSAHLKRGRERKREEEEESSRGREDGS